MVVLRAPEEELGDILVTIPSVFWPRSRWDPLSHHHSTASTAESNRRSQVSTIAPLSVDNHPTSCRTTPPLWSAQSPPLWSTSARSVSSSEDSKTGLKDGGSLFPSFRARCFFIRI